MSYRFFRRLTVGFVCLVPAAILLSALGAGALAAGAAGGLKPGRHYSPAPAEPTAEHRSVASRIKLIHLYRVAQGKSEKSVLTQGDLQTTSFLEIDGYVAGIVALCDDEMEVSIDGRRMPPITIGNGGDLWVKNFGKLRRTDLFVPAGSRDDGIRPPEPVRGSRQPSLLAGGYSFFPEVPGDAVSPELMFNISFEAHGEKLNLTVQQNGYTSLCAVVPDLPPGRDPIPFCYAGNPPAQFSRSSANIDGRIRAIAKGIGAVESAFSSNLIDGVTIIDAEDRHDAVTSNGSRRMWFYGNAFLRESLAELTAIAEHESLHILVDQLRLTDRLEVRELFSDLKGYEALSQERLELVATGRTPARPGRDRNGDALFFAFISENNFMKGMRGGHAQTDPEEFCTSFLHSLMHIERFGEALSQRLKRPDSSPRYLSVDEKNAVVGDYLRTLDVVAQTLADRGLQNGSTASKRTLQHLASQLTDARVTLLQERLQLR